MSGLIKEACWRMRSLRPVRSDSCTSRRRSAGRHSTRKALGPNWLLLACPKELVVSKIGVTPVTVTGVPAENTGRVHVAVEDGDGRRHEGGGIDGTIEMTTKPSRYAECHRLSWSSCKQRSRLSPGSRTVLGVMGPMVGQGITSTSWRSNTRPGRKGGIREHDLVALFAIRRGGARAAVLVPGPGRDDIAVRRRPGLRDRRKQKSGR